MTSYPGVEDYDQTQIVVVDVTFKNNLLNRNQDPTTLTFYYQPGTSPSDTFTWDGTDTTEPGVNVIGKLFEGRFQVWVDTTDFTGLTGLHWTGTGAAQAPGDKQINVRPRPTP